MQQFIQIKNVNQLKRLCNLKNREGFIQLNGGLRSSKIFYWNGEQFEIQNLIDDSAQNLTPVELYTESNIGEAMDKKCLFIER